MILRIANMKYANWWNFKSFLFTDLAFLFLIQESSSPVTKKKVFIIKIITTEISIWKNTSQFYIQMMGIVL